MDAYDHHLKRALDITAGRAVRDEHERAALLLMARALVVSLERIADACDRIADAE